MEKKGIGWGIIIITLIFIWPVGLFLLLRKLASDKSALMSGKTGWITVIGWVLAVIGGIGFIDTAQSGDGAAMMAALGFLIGGIILIRKSRKTKKLSEKYKKYIDLTVNQGVRKIDHIASAVGLTYENVAIDLQNMINIGYLKNAYIDQNMREIVLMQAEKPLHNEERQTTQSQPKQSKPIRCPGCGANNIVLEGTVSECEYCGGRLTVDS